MSSAWSIVEHIVLFRFKKEAEAEKVRTCIKQMKSLINLDSVLHLTAGEIHNTTTPPSSPFSFTHILHSRYSSKSELSAYTNHPLHVSLVEDTLLPICDDIMAVDWINGDEGWREKVELRPGWGMELVLVKARRRLEEEEKGRVLRTVGKRWGEEKGVVFSRGENFSPARGKGFSLASMAVFTSAGGMEVVGGGGGRKGVEEEIVKGGVGELVENVIVVRFVFPLL